VCDDVRVVMAAERRAETAAREGRVDDWGTATAAASVAEASRMQRGRVREKETH